MTRPNLLVLAGHDPSGGAGIQADIESAAANGAHAATVTTLLTCQDTRNVHAVSPVDSAFFKRCLDTVRADMSFAAVKIGVVANREQIERIAATIETLPPVPVVLDPVLRAAGGGTLADDSVGLALRERLFALATVITPNANEARLLCDSDSVDDIDACGARLCEYGCDVLITGGDEHTDEVVNRLYRAGKCVRRDRWQRLPGSFHGSGCTLASALAARLAVGESPYAALQSAQSYTQHTLAHAWRAGRGQAIPARWIAIS